jgi:hypothetical protein
MKLKLLLGLCFFSFQYGFAQEIYFKTGKNFTNYKFSTSGIPITTPLQSGIGTSLSLGYADVISSKWSYTAEINFNDYNAIASSPVSNYTWVTKYFGIQTTLQYSVYQIKRFQFLGSLGLNLSSIIYGKQDSNGQIFDLKKQKEFSGLKINPLAGISANYTFSPFGHFSLGYFRSSTVRPSLSNSEKITFNTSQLLFGIHFNVKN